MTRDTTRVHVTTDHVRNGTPVCPERCAVALAILDSLEGACTVLEVREDYVTVRTATGKWWAAVEEEMAEFIDNFDSIMTGPAGEEMRDRLIHAASLDLLQWDLKWEEGELPPPPRWDGEW